LHISISPDFVPDVCFLAGRRLSHGLLATLFVLLDHLVIAEGIVLVEKALSSRRFGPYTLQAAIAVLLRRLAVWRPFEGAPIHIPIAVDFRICVVALFLALVSGLLFAIVPMRQVLQAHPYDVVKSGWSVVAGRRIAVRDLLLVLQIAICAVLVTSSMVAVRGLLRSLNSALGFDPRNTRVLGADLCMVGYSDNSLLLMQRRLVDAMGAIPGLEHAGLVTNYPPLVYTSAFRVNAYRDDAHDLSQSKVTATPHSYDVSPGYFEAAGTRILARRGFSWRDDKNAPRVAIANLNFALKMFGLMDRAVGAYYRNQHGNRIQIVGVAEDGKYMSLTEDQQPAVLRPFLQSSANLVHVIVRSTGDPQTLASAMRAKLRELDPGLPVDIQTWKALLVVVFSPGRIATMALGALGKMGAILSITGIRHGRLFREQANPGTGCPDGAGCTAERSTERGAGTCHPIACHWFGGRIDPRSPGEQSPGLTCL
jgi:hypothetical protein